MIDKIKKVVVWEVVILCVVVAQQMQERWVTIWGTSSYNESANVLVCGSDGYVYAGGAHGVTLNEAAQRVLRLDPANGAVVGVSTAFQARISGLSRMVYGNDGGVYTVGTYGVEGTPFPWTSMTVKRAWGWGDQFDHTTIDDGTSIVYGEDGNIYACGYGIRLFTNAPPHHAAFVISYSPDGSRRWTFVYDPYQTNGGIANDIAYGSGNVYYCGVHNSQRAVICLTADNGNVSWVYTGGSGSFSSLVYERDGNIYTIGGDNITSLKSTDGSLRWTYGWSGSKIIYGSDGNIYAIRDNGIISLTTEGDYRWSYNTPGAVIRSIIYSAADGNVYVCGETNNDLVVIKINSVTGEEIVRYIYNGPTNEKDVGYTIDVGIDGYLYVGGYTTNNYQRDLIVISLDPNPVNIREKKLFLSNGKISNNWKMSLNTFDILGRSIPLQGKSANKNKLPSGNYFIPFYKDNKLQMIKIVKF
ncbi:MAG: PQQ-binding-like beta-propeller repeat protein [candidate division WOR-3 bacterium]